MAPGPTPGWDQPLLLVPATARPATRRRLPTDGRCSLGQRDRDRLPNGGFPHAASLLATAALSEGGCPFSSSFVSVWSTLKGWGVPARVGWSCGTPKLEEKAGGWRWCLSWHSPHLCRAYLWGLGEGETCLQWGHWLTKLFQSRGHEKGICTPTSYSLAEGTQLDSAGSL